MFKGGLYTNRPKARHSSECNLATYYRKMNAFTFVSLLSALFPFSARVRSCDFVFQIVVLDLVEHQVQLVALPAILFNLIQSLKLVNVCSAVKLVVFINDIDKTP